MPGPSFSNTAAIGGWPQNPENRSPYSMQWNIFIQRELMNDLSLDIGYVGSGSRKQIGYSPFNNALTPGPGAIDPRRLLPQFGDLDGGSNQYNGSYNSLQVSLIKRFSNGLLFNTNYTWQKSLDGQSSLAEVKVQNPFDRRQDYSRSSWDINHVFNFSYVYELPFGRVGSSAPTGRKAGNLLFGGWTFQGITRLESGPPDQRHDGSGYRQHGSFEPASESGGRSQCWSQNAGRMVQHEGLRTAGAVHVRHCGSVHHQCRRHHWPSTWRWQKKFRITENHALEFKTEFFNVPNTCQLR